MLAGDVPNPADPPPGCAFHTRCRHAQERCRRETPALEGEGPHRVACHFWRQIEAPASAAAAAPVNRRLQRLQSAFVT